ncbi:MAG: hypothetical protein RsTaC01_0426 [Candidatus Paraimprobicoccus trichonymphae]|uniref:Uncharacterized protein n=1 Tax=Candidatus Paraimprobicoccus trichonymphae TaxID=3033793 RepID=A0AA48HZL3_9FIRM|nr:MAG: hypothetical protein RsTaC01_0426 [Candidatus Paraimprobicoccus trichonymphae]
MSLASNSESKVPSYYVRKEDLEKINSTKNLYDKGDLENNNEENPGEIKYFNLEKTVEKNSDEIKFFTAEEIRESRTSEFANVSKVVYYDKEEEDRIPRNMPLL